MILEDRDRLLDICYILYQDFVCKLLSEVKWCEDGTAIISKDLRDYFENIVRTHFTVATDKDKFRASLMELKLQSMFFNKDNLHKMMKLESFKERRNE